MKGAFQLPLAPAASPFERTPEEWSEVLAERGHPRYRGHHVFRWLHGRGIFDPAQFTDVPKALREELATAGPLAPAIDIVLAQDATDSTRKLLVQLADKRTVETVLIPMPSAASAEEKEDLYAAADPDGEAEPSEASLPFSPLPFTQCISSQVGCAMGCVFCASGIAGLKRHLTAAEIVGQVHLGRAQIAARAGQPGGYPEGSRVRNVVFMGMGEPLANYDAVARSLVLLTHPDGIGLSRRRVTVSTSGLVPEIDRLGTEFGGQVQLAISLHAVDDDRRSSIMPINKKYPLRELMAALSRYPLAPRRRITIEYTLIKGFNASASDARALAKLLAKIPSKVNLIPMNPVPDNPLEAPSAAEVDAFSAALRDAGVFAFVRRRKGDDIAAACGQLALAGEKRKVRMTLPTLT
jgi:23S rRNA (adenine2503-C2)-methyltransferase